MSQDTFLKFSAFVDFMTLQFWQKKFWLLLNQPASHGPFWPKLWMPLATIFVEIFEKEKKLVRFWTHWSNLLKGFFNISLKMALWNLLNEQCVHLHDVHAWIDHFGLKLSLWPYCNYMDLKLSIYQINENLKMNNFLSWFRV